MQDSLNHLLHNATSIKDVLYVFSYYRRIACTRGSSIERIKKIVMYRKRRELDGEMYEVELGLVKGKIILTAKSLSRESIVVKIPAKKSCLWTVISRQRSIRSI